jgi:TPR repeat protein
MAIPLVIDPPSAVTDHYVLIEGLERDAFVSRGIEVLGGTWMVRGADLDAAEIERSTSAPERAVINLELRHVDGSIVGRQSVSLIAAPHEQNRMPVQPGANEPPRAVPETNSGSDAQRLLRRGQLMLDSGNLSGARLLWERAAEQGSSEAALALGRSYDPAQVPLPGVAGSVADRTLARRWYERAAALGSSEARERAKRLD